MLSLAISAAITEVLMASIDCMLSYVGEVDGRLVQGLHDIGDLDIRRLVPEGVEVKELVADLAPPLVPIPEDAGVRILLENLTHVLPIFTIAPDHDIHHLGQTVQLECRDVGLSIVLVLRRHTRLPRHAALDAGGDPPVPLAPAVVEQGVLASSAVCPTLRNHRLKSVLSN
jgi:hypothetical protein